MSDLFLHVQDTTWQARREAFWDKHLEYRHKLEGLTKAQRLAIRDFYLTGDIETLLVKYKSKKLRLTLYNVLTHSPFKTLDEFDHVVSCFCQHLADKADIDDVLIKREQEFFSTFLTSTMCFLDDEFIGEFAVTAVTQIFGEIYLGNNEIVYPLYFPVIGQPKILINPNNVIRSLTGKVNGYLFNKERHHSHAVYKNTIDYYLSLFPYIDIYPFSTQLIEKKYYLDELGYNPLINQRTFRMFFPRLYGYLKIEGEYGYCDPELQAYIKSKIEEMQLGKEYDAMVAMIHRHKGDVDYVSE